MLTAEIERARVALQRGGVSYQAPLNLVDRDSGAQVDSEVEALERLHNILDKLHPAKKAAFIRAHVLRDGSPTDDVPASIDVGVTNVVKPYSVTEKVSTTCGAEDSPTNSFQRCREYNATEGSPTQIASQSARLRRQGSSDKNVETEVQRLRRELAAAEEAELKRSPTVALFKSSRKVNDGGDDGRTDQGKNLPSKRRLDGEVDPHRYSRKQVRASFA